MPRTSPAQVQLGPGNDAVREKEKEKKPTMTRAVRKVGKLVGLIPRSKQVQAWNVQASLEAVEVRQERQQQQQEVEEQGGQQRQEERRVGAGYGQPDGAGPSGSGQSV